MAKELKPVGRPPKEGISMSFKLKSEVVEIIKKQPNQTAFVENSVMYLRNSLMAKTDATLFSKAPEMLEMLKEIVKYGGVANFDNIKQLIKEATELN